MNLEFAITNNVRILVTNDDGPRSEGLKKLVEGLIDAGTISFDEILVITPENDRSGIGKAISWTLKVNRQVLEVKDYKLPLLTISGNPADAILYALCNLGLRPEVVVSGINPGANMGLEDLFNSGTIGGALEAALHGIPGVAASIALLDGREKKPSTKDYLLASKVVSRIVTWILNRKPRGVLFNVNVPAGVRKPKALITKLAHQAYWHIKYKKSGKGVLKLEQVSSLRTLYSAKTPGSDVWAVHLGYISVTPIDFDYLTSCLRKNEKYSELETLLNNINNY